MRRVQGVSCEYHGEGQGMANRWRKEQGDWTQFRALPNAVEIDLHRSGTERYPGPYEERMGEVWNDTLAALKSAFDSGKSFLLIRHGSSTSRPGRTTSRSVVRNLMRSPAATPYIDRARSIEHDSVFVAAIRVSRT